MCSQTRILLLCSCRWPLLSDRFSRLLCVCCTYTYIYTNPNLFGSTNLALGDVLTLLEAEFGEAEREYQHADVDTDQEEDAEERQENASAEKTSDEEDDHDLSHGEL